MPGFSTLPSAGGAYSIGDVPALKGVSGGVAGKTPTDVYNNIVAKVGIPGLLSVYENLTGTYTTDVSAVRTGLLKMLSDFGTTQGGVKVGLQTLPGGNGLGDYTPTTGSNRAGTKSLIVAPNTNSSDNSGGGGGNYAAVTDYSASEQATAYNTVLGDLQDWGLSALDPTLANQVWQRLSTPGDMTNLGGIIDWLRTTPAYQQRFPGNAQLIAEGKSPLSEATYLSTENSYQGYAQQSGLPASFLTSQVIGNLIANNVSAAEFQQRVQNGYNVAANAPAETRQLLKQYFGIDTGQLAAYYLNPANALTNTIKQTQAAVLGTEAEATGFGNLTNQQATDLAAMNMTDSSGNVAASQTQAAFAKAAALNPLEQAAVGTRGQATVTQQQLLDYAFPGQNSTGGTNAAQEDAALKLALGAKAAGLSGGGGYAAGTKGTAVGRAST